MKLLNLYKNPICCVKNSSLGMRKRPSNFGKIARQKMSDFRSGGARGGSYFSAPSSVIDDYNKGIVRTKEEREAAAAAEKDDLR